MEQVSVPTMKAVAKKLRHYIDIERREEGFDQSGITCYLGEFRSNRDFGGIGTFHYSCIQDRHMQEYYLSPLVRKRLESKGTIHKSMLEEMERRLKKRKSFICRPKSLGYSQRELQSNYQKYEKSNLLETTAELLIKETDLHRPPTTRPSSAPEGKSRHRKKVTDSGSYLSIDELHAIESELSSLVGHSTPKSTPRPASSRMTRKRSKDEDSIQSASAPSPPVDGGTAPFPANPTHIPGPSPYISYQPYYTATTPPASMTLPPQQTDLVTAAATPGAAYPPPLMYPYHQGPSASTPVMVDKSVGTYGGPYGKPCMKSTSTYTITTSDAITQTPVHTEAQTNKSKLYQLSQKQRKSKKKSPNSTSTGSDTLHRPLTSNSNYRQSSFINKSSSKDRKTAMNTGQKKVGPILSYVIEKSSTKELPHIDSQSSSPLEIIGESFSSEPTTPSKDTEEGTHDTLTAPPSSSAPSEVKESTGQESIEEKPSYSYSEDLVSSPSRTSAVTSSDETTKKPSQKSLISSLSKEEDETTLKSESKEDDEFSDQYRDGGASDL